MICTLSSKKIDLWHKSENTPYDTIFRKFHLLLGETAYEWYNQYHMTFRNWDELKQGLLNQFTTSLTIFARMSKLATHRQAANESAMVYIAKLQREFEAAGVTKEQEKISIVQHGLLERLRNVAMSRPWNTVQELDMHLRTIEASDDLRKQTENKPKKWFYTKKTVNVVEPEGESGQETEEGENENKIVPYECESDESNESEHDDRHCYLLKRRGGDKFPSQNKTKPVNKFSPKDQNRQPKQSNSREVKPEQKTGNVNGKNESKSSKPKGVCFRCKSDQHWIKDCTEPLSDHIECWRCGKPDVLLPDCDCKANPKNLELAAGTPTASGAIQFEH